MKVQTLRRKQEKHLHDLSLGKEFLEMTSKSLFTKAIKGQIRLSQIKAFTL